MPDSLDTSMTDSLIVNGLCENFRNRLRSITVESSVEDSFVNVPKNLTSAEIVDILNGNIDDIDQYENIFVVDLDSENFKNFCSQQLNLNLEGKRSDHQHIYSNILSMYKHNMENGSHGYSVKELVLLAVAANDDLAEQYQNVLFSKENLSLSPLLIGGEKYIKIFIERFSEIYASLSEKTIKTQFGQVNFFSAIALRREQELLNEVFLISKKLQDLKEILQNSTSDLIYGIFETASLTQNIGFIKIVLNSIEMDARFNDESAKKDLFKSSFITILETAIGQEHDSIVEYLCKKAIENKDSVVQEIYKEALASEQVITQIKTQVLKNIYSVDVGRKKKKQEIYNMLLQAASSTGNIEFITKVLELIKLESIPDQDKQAFFHNSLITILKDSTSEKSVSIVECVCKKYSDSIAEILKNKEREEVKQQAAKNILNNAEELVKKAVQDKDVSILSSYVDIVEASVMLEQSGESLPIVKRIQEVVDKFAEEQGKAWSCYPGNNPAYSVYALAQKAIGYISHDDYKIVQGLVSKLRDLLKKNITASPVAEQPIASDAASVEVPESTSDEQPVENVLETKKENDTMSGMEIPTQETVGNHSNSTINDGESEMGKSNLLSRKAKRKERQKTQKQNQSSDKGTAYTNTLTVMKDICDEKTGNQIIDYSNAEEAFIEDVVDEGDTLVCKGSATANGQRAQPIDQVITSEIVSNVNGGDTPKPEIPVKAQAIVEDVVDVQDGEELPNARQIIVGTLKAPAPISGGSTPDNDGQPSDPGQNVQKSKLPTIAILILIAVAVGMETAALCMYFVLQASLLATAIVVGVGACCLVAAAVVHYCNKPASTIVEQPTASPLASPKLDIT
jgi:hypothetical protein